MGNIPTLIKKISVFAEDYDVECLLVENGSQDGSYQLMKSLAKDNPKIRIIKVETNQGYGYGLYQGINEAKGTYIGWIHADMQLPIEEVATFMDFLNSHLGTEKFFLKGTRHNRSLSDYLFTFSQGLFDSVLFGTWLYDISAIPVFFERSLLLSLKNVPHDFSIEIYIYLMAKKSGFHIERFPVHMVRREKGQSSWNTGLGSKVKQSLRIIKASISIKKNLK